MNTKEELLKELQEKLDLLILASKPELAWELVIYLIDKYEIDISLL